MNSRTQLVVPGELATEALRRSGLPDDATLAQLARFALARLAGWPRAAALVIAAGKSKGAL
jgi:hypothetical protein